MRRVLLATEVPTDEERRNAVALVPWASDGFDLAGYLRASLDNQAVDLIDATVGPGHARTALVALYEGSDVLLQAALELAESSVEQAVFTRLTPFNPLDHEALPDPSRQRFPRRAARYGIENAAVKVASAADHLVNTHLRLAWEANAATLEEMHACRFDPEELSPALWPSVEDFRRGLVSIEKQPLGGLLPAFQLTEAFRQYEQSAAVEEARRFRHEIVHRERPSYREAPAFGRASRWADGRITVKYPPPTGDDGSLPGLEDRRLVGDAGHATFDYAIAIWEFARRWLRSVDVWINREDDAVKISTTHHGGPRRYPRESRDPGPYLRA